MGVLSDSRPDGVTVRRLPLRKFGLKTWKVMPCGVSFFYQGRGRLAKKQLVGLLLLRSGFSRRGGIGFAIELKGRKSRLRAATTDSDERIAEAVADGFAGVDRCADHSDRTQRLKTAGRSLAHEQGRPAAADMAALAVHQGKHVFLAVGVGIVRAMS